MTTEELEAKLETVSRERDEAHARWVAIINGRGTTISDVETLTNELNSALSQRDKVRVELREARILTQEIGDVCRNKREPSKRAAIILGPLLRERDEARAEVQRLTDERDELLVRVTDQGAELRATREAYREQAHKLVDALRSSGLTTDDCRAVETIYAVAGHVGSHRIVEAMRYLRAWLVEAKP